MVLSRLGATVTDGLPVQRRQAGASWQTLSGGELPTVSAKPALTRSRRIAIVATWTSSSTLTCPAAKAFTSPMSMLGLPIPFPYPRYGPQRLHWSLTRLVVFSFSCFITALDFSDSPPLYPAQADTCSLQFIRHQQMYSQLSSSPNSRWPLARRHTGTARWSLRPPLWSLLPKHPSTLLGLFN